MSTPATILIGTGDVLARALAAQTVYIALGSGLPDWDTTTSVPQPAWTRTGLYNEVARAVATVTYLDAAGTVTVTPTHWLSYTATFGTGIANGTLREMALVAFGSGTLGSGVYFQGIHFPAISKPTGGSDFALTRTMRYKVF